MEKITRREFFNGLILSSFSLAHLDVLAGKKKDRTIPEGAKAKTVDRWVYSTCGYCSVGCGIMIGLHNGKAIKVRGNPDSPTNRGKLCIKGTTEYLLLHTPHRATSPLARTGDSFAPVPWSNALSLMSNKFKEIMAKHGPNAVAVYSTGQLQNEEFYALGKLARAGFKTDHYDGNTTLCMSTAVAGYKRSLGEDTPPGCYEDIDEADCIMLVGSNISEMHPILFDRLVDAVERHGTKIITVDPRQTLIASRSDEYLPVNPGTDVVLFNAMTAVLFEEGLVNEARVETYTAGLRELKTFLKRFTPEYAETVTGIDREKIRKAARLYGTSKRSLILWTMGVNQSANGTKTVNALCNLSLLTGNIGRSGAAPLSLTGQCNAMGSRALGSTTSYPGFRKLEHEEDVREIAALWRCRAGDLPRKRTPAKHLFEKIRQGEIKALWIVGTNPMGSFPDTGQTRKALETLEFLVVQDVYHPTETSVFAHLVLPGAMWGEKTGTMINTERRVNLARKAVNPPGEAKSDFEIILAVAAAMGYGALFSGWKDQQDAFDEMRAVTRGRPCDLYGMTYGRLERERGVQWPCPEAGHPGTQRLYKELKFYTPDGKARLLAVDHKDLAERPGKEFPFVLNTGRNQYHWHTGTKTRKIEVLNELSPHPYVLINPEDARAYGVKDQDMITVASRRGSVRVRAKVTQEVRRGSLFIPFHFGERTPNTLVPDITDEYSFQPNFKQSAARIIT